MKFSTVPSAIAAAAMLAAPALALHGHSHLRHPHSRAEAVKRGGQCQFPTNDPNMVSITPDEQNAGWAMSPDQPCKPGNYCPFACKPGMVMNQWKHGSNYGDTSRMDGGLFCNENGEIEKPYPSQPNCVNGVGNVKAVNKCGDKMSWCQTVLPGNEAMLIPNLVVDAEVTLAVPNPTYWDGTSAHFYINPPGTGVEGCIWGVSTEPIGNWSPYVSGANKDSTGNTFVQISWNPKWLDDLKHSGPPNWGVEIECPEGGCNGLPCKIDPSKGINKVQGNNVAVGADGANYCVVTVPAGKTAHIVAYNLDGSTGSSSGSGSGSGAEAQTSAVAAPKPVKAKVVKPKTTAAPKPKPTTTKAPVVPTTTEKPTTSSTSTTSIKTTTSLAPTTTSEATSVETTSTAAYKGGVFHEQNGTTPTPEGVAKPTGGSGGSSGSGSGSGSGSSGSDAAPSTPVKGEAGRRQGSAALAGLVVAFAATTYFL